MPIQRSTANDWTGQCLNVQISAFKHWLLSRKCLNASYLKCLFISSADWWKSDVWIKSHSYIGHSNIGAGSYSAPMFECRLAAVGHQGSSFSGCQGDEMVRLSNHLFVACNKSSIKEKIIFLSILVCNNSIAIQIGRWLKGHWAWTK